MIKSKQIVKWGGIDNTIIPKMQDDIKEQNTLLNEQEKIQGRLFELEGKITAAKKGATAGDKEQLRIFRELVAERKKLIAELNRQEAGQSAVLNLTSLQERLQKSIVKSVTEERDKKGNITSQVKSTTMEYYKTNQATHKFMENILGVEDLQASINSNIGLATPLLESNSQAIQNQGQDYARLIQGSAENLDLTMKLSENYDNIGGSDFQDQTKEAEALLKQRMREGDYIKNVLKPAMMASLEEELSLGKINKKQYAESAGAIKNMVSLANQNQKQAKSLVDTTREQAAQSRLTAATIDYMSKPMQMLKTGMEALPFGGVASNFIDLEGIIGDFQGNVQQTIANALEQTTENGKKVNNMNFGLAVTNVTKAMNESIDQIKKGVEGMSVAFKGMNRMSSGVMSSLLPIVAILAVAGKLAQIFFKGTMETRKEFGLTFTEAASLQKTLNTTAMEFKMMGVSAEDVKAGAQGIMDNLGGVSQVTKENITAFAQMNATLGISGENAGVLAVNMMAVGVSSMEAVNSQLQSVAALAQASGVAPASVMNDVAQNADKFAEFAKDGGENVFKAAIGARQLGVNMATVSGAADALLDFESSINAQMEASMLTGKMINTDKARELALSGDLAGMQKEIVSQIGSQAEFDRMNVVQRQAMAKAFGVSVQDLAKMVANQEKLNNMTEAQKQRQDMVAGVIQMVNSLFSRMVKNLEPLIPIAIAILSPFLALGAALAVVVIATGEILNFIMELGGLGKVIMGVTSALITYNFYQKLFNMQIGKAKKETLLKAIVDSKVGGILRLNTIQQKLLNAQTAIANKLDIKGNTMKLRMILTEKVKNIQRMFGLEVLKGTNKATFKNLAVNVKNIAVGLKEIAVQKLKNLASLSNIKTMAIETASRVRGLVAIAGEKAATIGLTVAKGALSVGTAIAAGAMTAFNTALLANPIGLVVVGVVALIAGIALLIKKFGAAKVIGSILKVVFFPLFGIIGTFKLIGSAIMGLKGLFQFFGDAVKAYLNIAFAPFFLAYKIFQKAKNFIGSFFGGGGDGGGEAAESNVTPESNAGKGGTLRQTVTETTIRGGQIVESKSQTKEITTRLDKLNSTGQQNVDASNRTAGQTQRLNSSIATG